MPIVFVSGRTHLSRSRLLLGTVTVAMIALLLPRLAHANDTRCAAGLYAGKNTSCAVAKVLLAKVGRNSENIADGRRVKVISPVTRKAYSFFLYRADVRSFTCRAYGNGVLSVRILTKD